MSDSDFSDELLELAGAGEKAEKKRKKRPRGEHTKSSTKRRKADAHMESSDNEYESEEDVANPYPLEGRYKDEQDRHELMQLPEIERENVLAARLEELQRIQDKRNLDQMLRAQRGGDDSVSKAAKRAHAPRGATKEKSRQLDELKAKRKAKGEKKSLKRHSPKRERSSSPVDMDMSDDEEEDGQISKLEEEEEREQRLVGKQKVDEEPITIEDLERCRLKRDEICRHALHPWFEEYVKGAWVRYLIGNDDHGQPVYRVCEIINLAPNLVKPYRIDGKPYDQHIELKYGKAVKAFPFDKVSNGDFTQREFMRWLHQCQAEQVKPPTKRALEKKREQMQRLPHQPLTNKDIDSMLARKAALEQGKSGGSHLSMTLELKRHQQAHHLALQRNELEEAAQLAAQIAELEARIAEANGANANGSGTNGAPHEQVDLLALVNERNRKANLEVVRGAEIAEAERRRRERLAWKGASRAGTPIPAVRKLFGASRTSTPLPGGTPLLGASSGTERSVSPMPNGGTLAKGKLSAMVAAVEVDLGDF